ncbi:type I glyceraldehyde-3-phosphate dehydrogenase [Patescibacteria group bacterium]|nr:type I glyceraldehyde-3-phosphate dehydrogenase [Patescibacteria group bacterium]
MKTFAINGFGRIGRLAFRVWFEKESDKIALKVINTSGSMNIGDWVHLIKHDTVYGSFKEKITFKETQNIDEVSDENPELGYIKVGEHKIVMTAQRDPAKIPWTKYEVDIVLESTGQFNKPKKAIAHINAGAKKVLLSAPTKSDKENEVSTSVISVNEFDKSKQIFSNASCTTNCVAPLVKIMKEKFGIEKAVLTTIHSYTDDQNLHDNSHKKDMRRARNAASNIVPTSTGAAKSTAEIIPSMKGKFDGLAIRVPTPTVSLSDLTFLTKKDVTIEKVNEAFIEASKKDYRHIVAVSNEPLVSSDFIGCEYSSVVDLALTQVIDGNLVKVIAWYDNEWGYTCRLVEQLSKI